MRIFTDVIRKIRLSKTSSDYSLLPTQNEKERRCFLNKGIFALSLYIGVFEVEIPISSFFFSRFNS